MCAPVPGAHWQRGRVKVVPKIPPSECHTPNIENNPLPLAFIVVAHKDMGKMAWIVIDVFFGSQAQRMLGGMPAIHNMGVCFHIG